jgi:predicted O-methyltransferase YrrM
MELKIQERNLPNTLAYKIFALRSTMDQAIRNFLQRLEESGRSHDQSESQHSQRYLNLEPETAEALALLLKIARVRNLLEIGTANGYSTIWIASALAPSGGRITSIEKNPRKHRLAQENLRQTGLLPFVNLLLGEATEVVASLSGPFDCVFFDADRISAPQQLELLLPKLASPALLLADNALSHPDQIAAYLARIEQLDQTSHAILKIGKGLSVAYRET